MQKEQLWKAFIAGRNYWHDVQTDQTTETANEAFEKLYNGGHFSLDEVKVFDFITPQIKKELISLWEMPNDGTNPKVRAIKIIRLTYKTNGYMLSLPRASEILNSIVSEKNINENS